VLSLATLWGLDRLADPSLVVDIRRRFPEFGGFNVSEYVEFAEKPARLWSVQPEAAWTSSMVAASSTAWRISASVARSKVDVSENIERGKKGVSARLTADMATSQA
jgi:hypothetical protein